MVCYHNNTTFQCVYISYFDGDEAFVYAVRVIYGYNQWKWHIVHGELTAMKEVRESRNALVELKCTQISCDHSTTSLLIKDKYEQ